MLNPTELVEPRCKETGTTPVLRSTRHFFLDLPKSVPQLQKWIDATSALGGWSPNGLQARPSSAYDPVSEHSLYLFVLGLLPG